MIHQYKIELQKRIKNQEKENNHFSRENVRENNKKFIENNMGIKIVYIYIVINTKLSKSSKSCYVIIFLYTIIIMHYDNIYEIKKYIYKKKITI